jgi:D-alanyl-D-alanine carboxypeptidase
VGALGSLTLGRGASQTRNDRTTDLLENGFKRYFWKSLFGTSLDRLAIQASLSDSPMHLRDSACGVGIAKPTVRRSVKSRG